MTKKIDESLYFEREDYMVQSSAIAMYQKQENCFWYMGECFCAIDAETLKYVKGARHEFLWMGDSLTEESGHPVAYKALCFIEGKTELPVVL